MNQEKKPSRKRRSWVTIVIIISVILLYAYAIKTTKVDLEEPLKPKRQEELVSLIHDLAHPDLFTYNNETRTTNISIRMPCPEDVRASTVSGEGRTLRLDPNCASTTQDDITASGTNFSPTTDGVILWFPVSQSFFHIERSEDGEIWNEIAVISADNTEFNDSGLACGSSYSYRLRTLRAIDSQFSPYSSIASDLTGECELSSPFALMAEAKSQDSIALSWQGIPYADAHTVIQSSLDGITWSEVGIVTSDIRQFDDQGLLCDTPYFYRVRVVNTDGQLSAFSPTAGSSTASCEKEPPSSLRAVSTSPTEVTLEWSTGQVEESTYFVERSVDGENWIEAGYAPGSERSFTDSGLACQTEYLYRIRGFQATDGLHSQFSEVLPAATGDCSLEPPAEFTASAVSQFQADIIWQDTNDSTTRYAIERSTADEDWVEIGRSRIGSTKFEDTDLICDNIYHYRMRAVLPDGDAVSTFSEELSTESFACSKEPPAELTAQALSASEIYLSWQDVSIIRVTSRELAEFKTDVSGAFNVTFTMPDIREDDTPQRIAVVEILERSITGISDTTSETLQLILVTILMALMASTLGSITAIPLSFLGARNLMADVGAPLSSIMASVIGLAVGALGGLFIGQQISNLVGLLTENLWVGLVVLLLSLSFLGLLVRTVILNESGSSNRNSLLNILFSVTLLLLTILSLGLAAVYGLELGLWLKAHLGIFGFIGNFIAVLSELAGALLAIFVAAAGGLFLLSYFGRFGQESVLRLSTTPAKIVTALLAAVGTFVFVFGSIFVIDWICLLNVCQNLPESGQGLFWSISTLAAPIGVVAGLLSLLVNPKRPYPIGMVTYTVTRTTLNVLRAIEPVILGFTFVVWVGIGPFAGIMALMINSIADLGKLFSEQVENISEGPVEAVTATGANRLQVIVYSVVPQVVPHFIAFIFYRWDINVRMSTIIGFVGGGGIGVVLFRYTNQTLYQKAAVMVIAIAIVVTLLDYISSRIRQRII